MDLSSRTFLSNKKVDLLTDEKNELIYANDKIFENVYTTSNLNIHKNYDLVILDSYSSRTMSLKKKYAKKIPYVSIYGYFNGPEVNRILFSFFKMKMLLGLSFDSEKINKIAGPVIYIKNHKSHTKVESNAVSICIGGEWEYRTYKKWNKIIKKIIDSYDVPIYMVGSNNGMDLAVQIESELKCPRLHNHVGKETLIETANIIEKTSIFIGCDGGLLHVANGLGKIVLPLFARVDPSLRLTNKMQSFTLFDNQDVNNILVEDVVKNFERAFKLYQNHLQS